MSPITIAFLFLFAGILISIIKLIHTGYRFIEYVKALYPDKWKNIKYPRDIRRVLWPLGEGTATHFIYKSKETFGDESIEKFRRTIRQHTLFLVIVYPVSFMAFIAMVVWFLEGTGGGTFSAFWK